ncbi:MAG TPA: aminopeptidase P family protein [Acidimicrobiia bacterium]|jgi:Xaa-Pro aminopeptidase
MTLTELPALDVAGRIDRLRERFDEAHIDALFVTRLVNVRYLTGFTGSAALLLVGPDEVLFVSDGRYRDQAADQLAAAGVPARIEISGADQKRIVHDAAVAAGYGRVGLEAHGVTWSQQRSFASEWFTGAELVPTEGLVEGLRRVKDAGEVARIRSACAIADVAFANVRPLLAGRPTEIDFALDLEFEMRRLGAAAMSFEPIVAAGPNGAKPHARPSGRHIEPGELLVLDFGCMVDGYCSDMTRTVSVGDPGPEARRMYEVVAESQRAGRDAVREGVDCAAVDKACRDVIAEAGWADAFLHGTGHGVGLEIHEDPRVAATGKGSLAAGYVVTVEPGVYLTGIGGVRIEDTVVVTPDGCDILTGAPKELVIT